MRRGNHAEEEEAAGEVSRVLWHQAKPSENRETIAQLCL